MLGVEHQAHSFAAGLYNLGCTLTLLAEPHLQVMIMTISSCLHAVELSQNVIT